MRRYGRVVLGGTFDHLHVGHEALLGTALRSGRTVAIGLTSATYLSEHPKPGATAIAPERVRRRRLAAWLRRHAVGGRWEIVPIDDRFGGSTGPGVDALVVSADTLGGGRAVNRERRRLGRPAVPLLVVPLVLADDLEPVSSRRIRAGEIDRNGHRTSRLSVGVVAGTSDDARSAAAGVARAYPRSQQHVRVASGPGAGRALARRRASQALRGEQLGVGVVRAPRGWLVAVRGPHAALEPRLLPGDRQAALATGITRLLRNRRRG